MAAGLLTRVGLILLALAFLGGAMPRVVVPVLAFAPVAAGSPHAQAGHDHAAHGPQAAADLGDACAPDGKPVPAACTHANECLACFAADVPVVARHAVTLHWRRVAFLPAAEPLHGVTTPPELFPPIRLS
jgi:hypothetical protein